MIIRQATPQDTEACVSILIGWIEETPWMPMIHSRASQLEFWRNRLKTGGWLAEENGTVLGFARKEAGHLNALYLAPEGRGRGIGKALLEAACAGEERITLYVFVANERARRFYKRAGFVEVSRTDGDNEEGLPDILLARQAR
ncbi:MAG: GNAT family N-acetyltransferase [Pseudomonadota bacterium]